MSGPWTESKLISADNSTIYTVRDCPGQEREILHAWRHEWTPISKAKFSVFPCFEDYHREKFKTAVPYTESKP